MGAGAAKLLSYLDVGPEAKEDKLKSENVERVLTSGKLPKKQILVWKQLPLDKNNTKETMQSLLEGSQFIQTGRVNKRNTLVIIQEKDPDSLVFAAAYLMAISGLSPDASTLAITRALKEGKLKLTGQYDRALHELKSAYHPKDLRAAVVGKGGDYSQSQLTEDVVKIYELAGLLKPTMEEINLDVVADETRRVSLAMGAAIKDDKHKLSKDGSNADAALMSSAAELLKKDLESNDKGDVSAGLKEKVRSSADKASIREEELLSKEALESLLALHSNESVDFPKILGKIKKRGEILALLSFYTDSKVQFDNFSLTDVTASGIAPREKPEDIHPSYPDTTIKPSEPKEDKKADKPETGNKGHKGSKADSLFDEFSKRFGDRMEFDNNTYTNVGFPGSDKDRLDAKHEPSVNAGSVTVNEKLPQVTGKDETTGSHRYKITIIRAYSRESENSTSHVDEYLASTTEEERMRNRKNVTIVRAYSRDAYAIED
ncbi:hypothetical protein D915_004263 [Fasciola hepatica]|uniref:Uncharacterized protein n=1 Tax=Fasciola hepatica TaxID=6192 RepID=A0A2H1C5M7_FASHE|nr:hypothetical protein D915_004263 [Fasciola hepatica]